MVSAPGVDQLLPSGWAIDAQAFGNVGVIIGQTLFAILVIGVIYWFFLRPMFYKIRVIILARRGGEGSVIVGYDKGKYGKDRNGIEKFNLLKRKQATIKYPEYKYIQPTERGAGTLFLFKFGENDYTPIDVSDTFVNSPFMAVDSDHRNLLAIEHRAVAQKYAKTSRWKEFAPYLLIFGGLIIIMVMFWMLTGQLQGVASAVGGASNNLADAVRELSVAGSGVAPAG
jgi:hypothetical protein